MTNQNTPEYVHITVSFDAKTKLHDALEDTMDDEFIPKCTDVPNEHGKMIKRFVKILAIFQGMQKE